MRNLADREFCARCGNYFPPGQVGDCCRADGDILDQAAAVILRRSRNPRGFWPRALHLVLIKGARQVRLADGPHLPKGQRHGR